MALILGMGKTVTRLSPRQAKKKARYIFSSGLSNACKANFGGTCGGRTHDKRIKSPLLYHLSKVPRLAAV